MKKSRIISFVLAIVFILSAFQVFTFAGNIPAEDIPQADNFEVVFVDDLSPEIQARIIAHLKGEELPNASTRGITCTLFGHDLETSPVYTYTHLYYSTAPKCRRDRYEAAVCTRCDYVTSTFVSTERVNCCQ